MTDDVMDTHFIMLKEYNKFWERVNRALEGKGLEIKRALSGGQYKIYVVFNMRYILLYCEMTHSGQYTLRFGIFRYNEKYSNGIDIIYKTELLDINQMRHMTEKRISVHVDKQLKKVKEIKEKMKLLKIEKDFQ